MLLVISNSQSKFAIYRLKLVSRHAAGAQSLPEQLHFASPYDLVLVITVAEDALKIQIIHGLPVSPFMLV